MNINPEFNLVLLIFLCFFYGILMIVVVIEVATQIGISIAASHYNAMKIPIQCINSFSFRKFSFY
jgi:hypothetical protein